MNKLNFKDIHTLLLVFLICSIYVVPDIKFIFLGSQFLYIFYSFIIRNKIKLNTNYLIWMLAFIFLCIISSIWAVNPLITIRATLSTIQVFVLSLALTSYIKNEKDIDTTLKIFILAAVLLIFRLITSQPLSLWGTSRLGISIGYNSNTLGLSLVISALCAYFLAKKESKNLYYFFVLLFLATSLFSGSRKSIVISIVGIIFLEFKGSKSKIKIKNIISLILLLSLSLYFIFNNEVLYNLLGKRIIGFLGYFSDTGYVDNSTLTRLGLLEEAKSVISKYPILGVGLDNFRFYNSYNTYSHVNILEILTNLGLIGGIIYYAFSIALLINLFNRLKENNMYINYAFLLILIYFILDFAMVSYNIELNQLFIALSFSIYAVVDKE